jgi:hypothetical protein
VLNRLVPRQSGAPFAVPPVAFICALFGAPLVIAFFGFWIFLIPVFALYFGGPLYLVCAGPACYWYLKRRVPKTLEITLLAIVVNTIVTLVLLCLNALMASFFRLDDLLVLYGGFGSVMSAIWGATFCKLYVWFKADTDKTR